MSGVRPPLLLITRNLPPLVGGMERLNVELIAELADSFEVTVVGPKGATAPGAVRMYAAPSKKLPVFLVWAMVASTWVAIRKRPRWILGGSGLVAPAVMLAAWISGARSGLYLHGLDIVVKHPLYQRLWLPAIRRATLAMANSTNTMRLAVSSGVRQDRIEVLFPGVTLDHGTGDAQRFRSLLQGADGSILLSVGRLTARKGIAEFIENVFPAIVRAVPDVTLVVIGSDAKDALLKGGADQRARIVQSARSQGLHERVLLLGSVDEQTLADAFAASDVHVFPVLDLPGDVEGFGMVAIEAAARGLPTIAYSVGGVPDAVSDGISGVLIHPGDYDHFADAIVTQLQSGRHVGIDARRSFARDFAWEKFGNRLRTLLAQRSAKHER